MSMPSMQHLHARNVVVGAGAMGASAAYHLARRGEPVLLVEQFAPGHDRGSSHGAARITRHSYADPHYARLMPEAFRAWRELEADAGQNLYVRTGGVSLCPPGVDYVGRVAANLEAIDVPCRRMTGRALRRAYPVFGIPDDTDVVFEPDAGMLAAARSVAIEVALAR
jgi:sarcosine oxidase